MPTPVHLVVMTSALNSSTKLHLDPISCLRKPLERIDGSGYSQKLGRCHFLASQKPTSELRQQRPLGQTRRIRKRVPSAPLRRPTTELTRREQASTENCRFTTWSISQPVFGRVRRLSTCCYQILRRDADVTSDLPQQDRRNVTGFMKRHRRSPTIWVAKLLVRSALPNFDEA